MQPKKEKGEGRRQTVQTDKKAKAKLFSLFFTCPSLYPGSGNSDAGGSCSAGVVGGRE